MPIGSQLFTYSKKDAIVFTTYSSQQEVQMAERWVRELAEEVIRTLGLRKDHLKPLSDGKTYFPALRKAAVNLSIDLNVAGRWEYARSAVQRSAKVLIRTEDHPIGAAIKKMNGENWVPWIETALPPGDRD